MKGLIANTIIVISAFLFSFLLFIYIPNKIEENANSGVKVGEIWMWEKKEPNPFEILINSRIQTTNK